MVRAIVKTVLRNKGWPVLALNMMRSIFRKAPRRQRKSIKTVLRIKKLYLMIDEKARIL